MDTHDATVEFRQTQWRIVKVELNAEEKKNLVGCQCGTTSGVCGCVGKETG